MQEVNWCPGPSLVQFGGRMTEIEDLKFLSKSATSFEFSSGFATTGGGRRSGFEDGTELVLLVPTARVGVVGGGSYRGEKVAAGGNFRMRRVLRDMREKGGIFFVITPIRAHYASTDSVRRALRNGASGMVKFFLGQKVNFSFTRIF
ncbi:unnamed protein product [Prunus armeniaca]